MPAERGRYRTSNRKKSAYATPIATIEYARPRAVYELARWSLLRRGYGKSLGAAGLAEQDLNEHVDARCRSSMAPKDSVRAEQVPACLNSAKVRSLDRQRRKRNLLLRVGASRIFGHLKRNSGRSLVLEGTIPKDSGDSVREAVSQFAVEFPRQCEGTGGCQNGSGLGNPFGM